MSPEVAIRAQLLATSAVTALVSTRIYQLKIPQTPTLPAVRVQLIDEPQAYHLRGSSGAVRSRVQVDNYGSEAAGSDPYADVKTVADAIHDALSGQVFTAGSVYVSSVMRVSRRVGYEAEEQRLIRCSQDYIVWFRAAA